MLVDHISSLQLAEKNESKYYRELQSLDYLADGLGYLAEQVRQFESQVNERIGSRHILTVIGDADELKGIPQGMVACAFHWYSVSVCNYLRLIGWLLHGENSDQARDYVKRIVPNVYVWRNKVGAHFSRTAPKKGETIADWVASVAFPISFDDRRFVAGTWNYSFSSGGKTVTSEEMKWSLTETHESLVQRFAPNRKTD